MTTGKALESYLAFAVYGRKSAPATHPGKRRKPRRGRVVDTAFLCWMHETQPCLVHTEETRLLGACSGRLTAHHVRFCGSQKNDRRVIMLCKGAHLHGAGKHSIERSGKEGFERYWGVNIESAIELANAEYGAEHGGSSG